MNHQHAGTPETQYEPSRESKALFRAIATLRNETEIAAFFRDLLTPAEIAEFTNRWQAVLMLEQGKPYLEIADKLGMSTTTVNRCAKWLRSTGGGYRTALSRYKLTP